MKKLPILHKSWTEAIIVTLLVGILLTLFIPKFMDAQINVKITQAKSDLNRIINTVDILQQDLKDEELHSVHLFNDKLGYTRQSASFSVYSPQNKLSPVYSSNR